MVLPWEPHCGSEYDVGAVGYGVLERMTNNMEAHPVGK